MPRITIPLRWLPIVLVILEQIAGQLTRRDEFAELVALSASSARAEKHYGPIAAGTRRIDAPRPGEWQRLRQVQCGSCGLITRTVRQQRAHRTLDGRCLDPWVDYSTTGVPLLLPFYVTRDGLTVWMWGPGTGYHEAQQPEFAS